MVNTADLKSAGGQPPCGFESRHRHFTSRERGWPCQGLRPRLLPPEKLGPVPATALTEPDHAKNNLPDVLRRWRTLPQIISHQSEIINSSAEAQRPRTTQSFLVPKADLAAQNYDLSLNRYKEVIHEEIAHRPPGEILARLAELEKDITQGMKELEGMLA